LHEGCECSVAIRGLREIRWPEIKTGNRRSHGRLPEILDSAD
jgi:hypothetical protein